MKNQSPSIFNDIVGPVMVGPSSSHTCGPSRIGFLARQLLPGKLKKCIIEFARDGAYTLMYKGHRSDMGFINGLLGRRPENPRLRFAYEDARNEGIEVLFEIVDIPPLVPNISHLILENTDGKQVIVHADSTGGGTVNLLSIDRFPVSILGDCYELIIRTNGNEQENEHCKNKLLAMFETNEGITVSTIANNGLLNVKMREPFDEALLEKIRSFPDVTNVTVLEPILAVTSNRHAVLPFSNAEEMLARAEATGKPLWELAIDYEMIRAGWSRMQILDYMEKVIETMEHGVCEALSGSIKIDGIIQPSAATIDKHCKDSKRSLDMGVLNTAVSWAVATMEYSSSMGVVVCGPTGGSAGVFSGAVLGICSHIGLSMKKKVEAMLTTGIIGIVIARECNFSAELFGCQVETGAAAAMAGGALVYLMNGSPAQSCAAASCALQNILGNICDPVAGLVQIPCINRNALAAANAVVSANIIMGGFDPLIPLDQTVETMLRVGRQLPAELRCTGKGGLCITERGQQLANERENRGIGL